MLPPQESCGKRKLPLRIVDLRSREKGRKALRQRYRFVNWSRTETFFEGFGDEALTFLFREHSGLISRSGPRPEKGAEDRL